jgi:(2R)-ethylmalonyl-CoA mutase
VVGGIIPDADAVVLRSQGVAAVFTPKDYDATEVMGRVLDTIRIAHALPPLVRSEA